MKFNYYSDYELDFYISVIDNILEEYKDKVEMLENLLSEFQSEQISRGDD